MSNYIVVPNSKENLDAIINKDVKGLIIGIESLSIYPFEMPVQEIISLAENTDKEIIVAMNKMIHNADLSKVKEVLTKLANTKIKKVIIYDIGIYHLIESLKLNLVPVLSEEHLNASTDSHLFYESIGIHDSYVTSDITYSEILEIKKQSTMHIYYTVYGYLPIFYSRRMLLTNYFKYINKEKKSNIYYIYNNKDKYMIREFPYGTIIYSPKVNLINNIAKIKDLDYLVIDLSNDGDTSVIDNFLSNRALREPYEGFFDTKTIYKIEDVK